jgi:hypothetical protein
MCNPDGSVTKIWNRSWPDNSIVGFQNPIGGGQAWIRREATGWKPVEAFILGKNGTVYPPLSLKSFSQKWNPVYLIKIDQSNLWMTTLGQLMKIDLQTGKILMSFDFPKSKADFYDNVYRGKTKDGIYFINANRINLVDWDGKVRDLGAATLN